MPNHRIIDVATNVWFLHMLQTMKRKFVLQAIHFAAVNQNRHRTKKRLTRNFPGKHQHVHMSCLRNFWIALCEDYWRKKSLGPRWV